MSDDLTLDAELVAMLADLATLIGQRQAALRRTVVEAAAQIDVQLDEIDRLGLAAKRLITRLQGDA